MMKKILLLIISAICLLAGKIFAQTSNPEPTASSIESYIKYQASPALGSPAVDIPLYKLDSDDQSEPVSLSLSYNLYNSRNIMPPTEVGLGWTLFKGGIISKESGAKNNEFTEINDLTQQNADRFYYNIPGFSGVFQIYMDSTTNTLKLYDLSATKLKIEFVRDQTSTKLIINSFKITDHKGLVYNFNTYNITSFQNQQFQDLKNQRTSYVPTTITDVNNRTLVTYSYDLKTKTTLNPYGSTAIKYKTHKLNTITTSKGKIKFEYDYNQTADDNNQNKEYYTINNISLLTLSNKVISKFVLTLDNFVGLRFIKKYNANNLESESTMFEYGGGSDTEYGFTDSNGVNYFGVQQCLNSTPIIHPREYVYRVLRAIQFPTRGRVEYSYEASEIFKDYTNIDYQNANTYIDPFNQYFGGTDNIVFDTNNTREYLFTVHGASGTYPVGVGRGLDEGIDYGVSNHGIPVPFNFTVLNSSNTVMSTDNSINACSSGAFSKHYKLSPGVYKIKINSWGGTGNFGISELKSAPKPYKNFTPVVYGARVKKITYYDTDGITIIKQKKYEYNSFSNPLSSSGTLIDDPEYPYVLYKNVREIETAGSQSNGYVDYYYNIPYDYALGQLDFNQPYFNLTSHGILTKKNIYNSQNQLLDSTEYINNFTEVPNAGTQTNFLYFYVPGYVSSTREINTRKHGSSEFVTISEANYSPNNFQQMSLKVTTHNGDIQESTTKYAQDLSDTRLINANMISVPLETVVKENGNILSTSKTLFGNSVHLYPTSVVTTDLAQNPETQLIFDLYDDKGNLVQVTNKAGVSITTIWGYHKTLPIAQIVGAKYSDISSLSVVTNAVTASDSDADNSNEDALLTALNNLRLNSALHQYPITVYTYDPLVGVTNSISGNGIKVSYTYDASGRLSTVKDSNGNVLKENQYNYKH